MGTEEREKVFVARESAHQRSQLLLGSPEDENFGEVTSGLCK